MIMPSREKLRLPIALIEVKGHMVWKHWRSGGYRLDVQGTARVYGSFVQSIGDSYDIGIRTHPNGYAPGIDAAWIAFGNIYGSIGVNKQTFGTMQPGSLIIGRTSPNKVVALVDYVGNPAYVVDGIGAVTINGGYSGINPTSTTANGTNTNTFDFIINGPRATGSGNTCTIIITTPTPHPSPHTPHTPP